MQRLEKSRLPAVIRLTLASPLIRSLIRLGEVLGKCTIFFGIIVWLWEIPDRAQQKHDAAWALIAASHGQSGNGGRSTAVSVLTRDGVSLAGIDLSNATLGGVEFDDGDFRNANMSKVDFNGVVFGCYWITRIKTAFHIATTCTNLDRANFRGANLRSVTFMGLSFNRTDFTSATITDTLFSGGDHVVTTFHDASLLNGSFKNMVLRAPDFGNAKIVGTKFVNTKIIGWANFEGAEISACDWTETEVDIERLKKASILCNVRVKGEFIDRDCSQEFKDCEDPKHAPPGTVCP